MIPTRGFMFIFLLLCACTSLLAQRTVVSGTVRDAESGEALPFVNVVFVGTKVGAMTDIDGNFSIETYYASDSLRASFVGYTPQTKKVKKDQTQVINFSLAVSSVALAEAVVRYKKEENPAHPIMRSVFRNKDINNREKLDAYEYELYNKVEFDLNNITDEFRERRIWKHFDFVFDNLDSTEEKVYLPVFMTENLSSFYYRKNPRTQKEIIQATKVSGVENQSVSQFLGDMYQNVNIYENNIVVFGKSFVSPLSTVGFGFYNYYLMDSTYRGNKWCYQIKFLPKRKQELTFTGDMWVHDTTYAVQSVEASIAEDANINFINKMRVRQEYDQVEPEVWMLVRDELFIDFNVTEKTMGFYGRKTTTYRDFVINQERDPEFYKGVSDIVVSDDASDQDESFWDERRHITLTESEKSVYQMVDSVKAIPQFRTIADIITLMVSGYHIRGNFEYGPYFTIYSWNPIEGHRFRLGGRTSNDFSKRVMLDGYVAYGLRDERLKYGGGGTFMVSKQPRMVFNVAAKRDVEQLGAAPGAFQQDNLLASFLRRNPADKLTDVIEYKTYFEREWFYGLSNRLHFNHRTLSPLGSLRYERINADEEIETLPSLITSEVTFYTRFAYKEKYLSGEFERVSLGTKYPVLEAAYSLGLKGFLGGQFEYQKLVLRVKDRIRFGPFGYARVWVEGGKIWGNLPFPLLQLHQGNETFFYDETAFNTMNFFEFVSDEWVSASVTYHAEGLFLNKIPLMRRLKWREVASIKGVVGNFDPANEALMVRPPETFTLDRPFFEAALGIENIFKIIRIDALWRLSYLDNPDIVKFGFRAKFQFDF